MKFIDTKISDLIIIKPTLFGDARGYFLESYNQKKFEEVVGKISFVQDNYSKSIKNTLRGLHYQLSPMAQGKLVSVLQGEIFDVVVDLVMGLVFVFDATEVDVGWGERDKERERDVHNQTYRMN